MFGILFSKTNSCASSFNAPLFNNYLNKLEDSNFNKIEKKKNNTQSVNKGGHTFPSKNKNESCYVETMIDHSSMF